MAITVVKGNKGLGSTRINIPIEDAIFRGIRKNPTPRAERSYPTWHVDRRNPEEGNFYKLNPLKENASSTRTN